MRVDLFNLVKFTAGVWCLIRVCIQIWGA